MKPRTYRTPCWAAAFARVIAVLFLSLGLSALLWSRVLGGGLEGGAPSWGFPLICWLLALGGITGTAVTSFGGRFGWLLLFGLQPLWITYALATGQGGLVLGSVAYSAVQLNGYLRGGPSGCRR